MFTCIQYSLKGIHAHSECIQVHSILAQRHSCTLRACSNAFNCIPTCSKTFMRTHFHVGISKKLCSVAFRLTQRHSCALMHVQPYSMLTQRRSCALRAHSSTSITCSKAFTHMQSAFKHVQLCSVVVTLTQRHLVRSDN